MTNLRIKIFSLYVLTIFKRCIYKCILLGLTKEESFKIFNTKNFDPNQVADSHYKKMSDCIKFEHKTLLSGYLLSTQGDRVSL